VYDYCSQALQIAATGAFRADRFLVAGAPLSYLEPVKAQVGGKETKEPTKVSGCMSYKDFSVFNEVAILTMAVPRLIVIFS
jgi:hypothetical protein